LHISRQSDEGGKTKGSAGFTGEYNRRTTSCRQASFAISLRFIFTIFCCSAKAKVEAENKRKAQEEKQNELKARTDAKAAAKRRKREADQAQAAEKKAQREKQGGRRQLN
jgi:hypothetical protein